MQFVKVSVKVVVDELLTYKWKMRWIMQLISNYLGVKHSEKFKLCFLFMAKLIK